MLGLGMSKGHAMKHVFQALSKDKLIDTVINGGFINSERSWRMRRGFGNLKFLKTSKALLVQKSFNTVTIVVVLVVRLQNYRIT